jgi:transcriptional regulator with XRE-family HTH domain
MQMAWKTPQPIRKRLKAAREAAGLTQRELAGLSGVSASTIAQLEQGIYPDPRIGTLIALADALDIPLDELVGREPELPPKPEPKATRRGRRKR